MSNSKQIWYNYNKLLCHHCYSVIVIVLAVVTMTDFDVLYLADNGMEKWLA